MRRGRSKGVTPQNAGISLRPFFAEDRESEYEFPAGMTNNSLDDSAVPQGALYSLDNCSTERGVFQRDTRIKFWHSSPNSTTTHASMVLAAFPNTTPCYRVITLDVGASTRKFNVATLSLSSITSAQDTTWLLSGFGSVSDTGSWARGWQHLDKAYFAGGASGTLYSLKKLCLSTTAESAQVFKTKPWAANQFSLAVTGDLNTEYSANAFSSSGSENAANYSTMRTTSYVSYASTSEMHAATTSATWTFASGRIGTNYDQDDAITIAGVSTNSYASKVVYLVDSEANVFRLIDYSHDFGSAQDFTDVDYFEVKLEAVSSDVIRAISSKYTAGVGAVVAGRDQLVFDSATLPDAGIDVLVSTGTIGSGAALNTNFLRLPIQVQRESVGGVSKILHIWCDLTKLPAATKSAIRRLRLVLDLKRLNNGGGAVGCFQQSLILGYKSLLMQDATTDSLDKPNSPYESITYLIRYSSLDGQTVSQTLQASADAQAVRGSRMVSQLPEMGAKVVLSWQSAGSPWDSTSLIDVYRIVTDRTGLGATKYIRMYHGANTGSGSITDKYSDKYLLESGAYDYSSGFGSLNGSLQSSATDSVVSVACGCSWKASNVLGLTDGKVAFSRVGTDDYFIWPEYVPVLDPEDPLNPRRLQVTSDGSPITCLIPQDPLYIFSRLECFAMSGEYPSGAGSPRRLPYGKGAVSSRAACAHGLGCVVAADDGLWYVEVPYGFDGSADQVRLDEITINNRADWASFISAGTSSICVVSSRNEVWAFNGKKYVHVHPNGLVSVGTYTHTPSIVDALDHQIFGVMVLMSDGQIGVLGDYTTDGGTNAAGSNGSTFTWNAYGRKVLEDAHIIRVMTKIQSPDTSTNVSLEVTTERGGTDILTWAGASASPYKPLPRSSDPASGRWFSLKLSGGPTDIVESCTVETSKADKRRGY